MYLVTVPSDGFAYYVFLREDPKPACQPFLTIAGVHYDPGTPEELRWWSSGAPSELPFGRSISHPSRYRLFSSADAMHSEGYELVNGVPWIHQTWSDFLASTHGRRVARRHRLEPTAEPAWNCTG